MNASKVQDAYKTGTQWQNLTESERLVIIRQGMSNAMMMRGQGHMDAGTMETIAQNISAFILDEFPALRDKEFGYLLDLGISGELGQDTYVSGATAMKWVRMYYRHAERLLQVDAEEREQAEGRRLTPMQIAEKNAAAFDDAIHRSFEYYKTYDTIFGQVQDEQGNVVMRGFSCPQWAGQVYEHYRQLGKIPEPTEAQKNVALERADRALTENGLFVGKQSMEILRTSKTDWYHSYLLEQYFADVLHRTITL